MNLKIEILDSFAQEAKRLSKKYKSLPKDLKTLYLLLQNPQNSQALGENCFKIHLANSSVPTGKSGGFRVIHYYKDKTGTIYLMSIYSKSELQNINDAKIKKILKDNNLL
jgi:mRNA-degrading endonuclease RelE of RelBE toxin-antitoxin system